MITPELMKLIDVIAEAGTNLRIAACAKPEDRAEWLERLERDTTEARKLANEYMAKGNVLHDRIKIELRTEELASYPTTFLPQRRRPLGASYSCGHWVTFPQQEPAAGDGRSSGGRQVLPLVSNLRIEPGQTAQLTARPQAAAFRPQRLYIAQNAERWVINDIRIGNRSQLAQAGDLDGAMFGNVNSPIDLVMDTIQTAMDFALTITYVGLVEEGEEFRGVLLGVSAEDVPPPTMFGGRCGYAVGAIRFCTLRPGHSGSHQAIPYGP